MFKFLKRRKADPKSALRQVLGDYSLPSFPAVVMQALQRIRDPKSTSALIADTLSGDPGISTMLLRTVNSAAFALGRKVESVHQAVTLLGISRVESLVLSVGISRTIPRKPALGYDHVRFWRAAARRAATARVLARRLHPDRAAESFTASLLQDMAVPLLASQLSDTYGPLLEYWHHSDEDLAALEQNEFAWNHAEVATWQCTEWELPENLAAAIGGHHGDIYEGSAGPECPPAVTLVALLREREDNVGLERLIEVTQSQYHLPSDEVSQLVTQGFEAADELARLFV